MGQYAFIKCRADLDAFYKALQVKIWSALTSIGWYMEVLGQCILVLLGIEWYWVSKVLLSLYSILKEKNGDLVGCKRSLTD